MKSFLKSIRNFASSLINFRYLVFISSIVFIVILGIAFFLVYENAKVMRDQINTDFNQQQLILARQVAFQIDTILHDIEVDIEGLERFWQSHERLIHREAMRAVFERTRAKGVIEIGLEDPEGRAIEVFTVDNAPPVGSQRIKSDCYYDETGRTLLGPLRVETIDPDNDIVTCMFCIRINSGEGGKGFLYSRLDISRLISSVTHDIRSGRTGYAWVINESGIFLYHPEKEFIGKNAFTVRKQRKPYVSFKQINQIMKNRMLKGDEGLGTYISGWHRGIEGNITKLIAFTPVKSSLFTTGHVWSVAVAAPISEVAEAVHRVYVRHFAAEAALIAILFLFGLLAVIYQQRISQALQERVKKTEANLQETERVYQRVVEQATDLIYILDLDLRVVLYNRQSAEVFSHIVVGIPESDPNENLTLTDVFIGRTVDELFSRADAVFMRKQVDQVLLTQNSHSYENSFTIKGRKLYLHTKLIPIRDDQGKIYQILGISRDVTEKKEVDQLIYNTEKLASIGILASGVAHEINNPLAIILGFTDLLLERFSAGSSEYEDLKLIEENANSAKKTVEKLLGFARITEGMEDTVDVKQSVDTVISIVKNTLMTKKIELNIDIPKELPRVRGDTREVQQVIFNLINNSVAAMEGMRGRLTLTAKADNNWVHINVSDTGIGIPDSIKPQIFDPFFTTKKVGEGTGLGLSLCYGIIKKYGGKINFTSVSKNDNPNLPSGTTFTVSLPVTRV